MFRDVLQQEIQSQGLSVADVAKTSGVSKGAIYNILNGTTEDARIRPSTRRALARGCRRELEVGPDGSSRFVEQLVSEADPAPADGAGIKVAFQPTRPFLRNCFVADVFNWLHEQEQKGALSGVDIVDQVYQKRHAFLSLIVENASGTDVTNAEVRFSLDYDNGPSKMFAYRTSRLAAGGSWEATVCVCQGPSFGVSALGGQGQGEDGTDLKIDAGSVYRYEGSL